MEVVLFCIMKKLFRHRRSKSGRTSPHVLTWVLIVYILVSLSYQSLIFAYPTNQFQEVKEFEVAPCYKFWVRLPRQVPLLSSPNLNDARPITIWGMKDQDVEECREFPYVVSVDLYDQHLLGFLETEDPSPTASVRVTLGSNATNGEREQLFIYVPLSIKTPNKITLQIEVAAQIKTFTLFVQSVGSAWFVHFANLAFGIPTITFIAALGTVAKIYFDWKAHRDRELREYAKQQDELKLKEEDLGEQTINLYGWAKRLGADRTRIRSIFNSAKKILSVGKIWSKSLRQELVVMIAQKNGAIYRKLHEMSQILDFPDDEEIEAIKDFYHWYCGNTNSEIGERIKNALDVFQLLGLESCALIVDVIKRDRWLFICDNEETKPEDNFEEGIFSALKSYLIRSYAQISNVIRRTKQLSNHDDAEAKPEDDVEKYDYSALKTHWHDDGKSSGRYLLTRVSEYLDDADFSQILTDWQSENPIPPNSLKAPYRIWAEKLHFRPTPNSVYQDTWSQPFGPLKAEDDPRLPATTIEKGDRAAYGSNMFYSKHSLWVSAVSQHVPGFYFADPGMGKSAFLWMGRHERRYWGDKPSFSIYTMLTGAADKEILWEQLEHAIGFSLVMNLVEDPYWLIDADQKTQERVSAFLIAWAGTLPLLLSILDQAGLPEEDHVLVADMLFPGKNASPYQRDEVAILLSRIIDSMARGAARRLAFGESFELYLWLEFRCTRSVDDWLALIADEGLAALGVLKIFSDRDTSLSSFPGFRDLTRNNIWWTEEELADLLEHRLKNCGWSADPRKWNRWMKRDSGTVIEEQTLVKEANQSPRELIRLGNGILFGSKES